MLVGLELGVAVWKRIEQDLRFARLLSKNTVARFDAAAVAEGSWIKL